jgi:hypothetical protein
MESQAVKNPQRAVFAGVDGITKGCHGKYRHTSDGKPKAYSRSAIEHVIAAFEVLHILIYCKGVRIEDPMRGVIWRPAYIVAPHDFMTIRITYGRACACHFTGFPKEPLPGMPLRGPKIWVPGYGKLSEKSVATPERLRDDSVATPSRLRAHSGENSAKNSGADSADSLFEQSDISGVNVCQSEVLQGVLHNVSGLLEPLDPCESVEPFELLEPRDPRNQNSVDHQNDEATIKPLPQTVFSSSLGLLTDEDQNQRPSASREAETVSAAVTVEKYFANADSDIAILRLITDNEFEPENSSWTKFKHKENFISVCREAIRAKGTVKLNGRLTLAMLMGEVISILDRQPVENRVTKEKASKYPTSWLKIKGTMLEGGRLHEVPGYVKKFGYTGTSRYYSNPFAHGWLHQVFHQAVVENEIDLTPWESRFVLFKDADAGYRQGWEFIHMLTLALKEEPPALVTVRDWLWQRDAAPDKPKDPPWKVSHL